MPYVGNTNTTFTTFTTSDANVTDDLTVTDDASVGGDLTLTGSLKNGSTHFNVDSSGDVIIDSDTGNWRLKDAGTTIVEFFHASDEVYVNSPVDGQNIRFNVNNGGSAICPLKIHAEGYVTKENQPACHIELSGVVSNLTVGGASNTTIVFNSELFDLNSNFNTSTGIFTCPVAGKYLVNLVLRVENIDTAANTLDFIINTTQRNYAIRMDPDAFDSDTTFFVSGTFLTYAAANDTIRVQYYQDGGTSQTDLATAAFLGIHLVA